MPLTPRTRSTIIASLTLPLFLLSANGAFADPTDYEFRIIKAENLTVRDAVVSVELINKKTDARVPDAIIFAKRIDMAPDDMENMIMPIEEISSNEQGIYSFKTNLAMAGNWRLSLGAKVQNETGAVENRLIFKVAP